MTFALMSVFPAEFASTGFVMERTVIQCGARLCGVTKAGMGFGIVSFSRFASHCESRRLVK